ncbi:amidohydrolase family protein [Actinoplanes subtropicus]|uniref:amidohydrolase family protein n=1 Tax=Actinoplanes subtropicus TaxID=543632 RepID=UPI000689E9D4|nr:amidohydrolase family protein [Actinoplanes subtropicus]
MSRTLLRGAQVITMGRHRPDSEHADLLIDGDTIAGIGQNLGPVDETIDLTGRIIIPGLVNAHLHTWQAALRGVGADWTLAEYLANIHYGIARHYRLDDMHIGTLAGALNQINCGTTTLGDWCHNNPTPAHTDAAITGLLDSGIRAVFLHGTPYGNRGTTHAVEEVDRLLNGPAHAQPLITVGMAIRGPQLSRPEVVVRDMRAAQQRGLVVSTHQSMGGPEDGWEAAHAAGLIGPLTNVVHGSGLPDDRIRALTDAGASFTSTPENELGQGHGTPVTAQLLPLGAAPSLGTDTDAVLPGDMLTAARIALAHQRGLDHDRHRTRTGAFSMTATVTSKQALSWATVEGARALGLADRVGRIEPGMQADLAVIDIRALNLWPGPDPSAAALHAGVGNIESVMIAGRWRKREHGLLDAHTDMVQERLQQSSERLLHRLRQPGPLPGLRQRVVGLVVRHRLLHQGRSAHSATIHGGNQEL